ncbi:MAG TPA: V-type ATP synthase subunit F [Patescibacteria group bacterium]|nr:V-type ATP synthase subunit F [Patescibacteria group bacterium]
MDIVMIADKYLSSVFRLAGVEALEVEDEDSAVEKAEELVDEGNCKILLVTEKIAMQLGELREKLLRQKKFYPVFVIVPDFGGTLGERKKELTQLVNKSIGVKLKVGV